jgi:hypothetical protein
MKISKAKEDLTVLTVEGKMVRGSRHKRATDKDRLHDTENPNPSKFRNQSDEKN